MTEGNGLDLVKDHGRWSRRWRRRANARWRITGIRTFLSLHHRLRLMRAHARTDPRRTDIAASLPVLVAHRAPAAIRAAEQLVHVDLLVGKDHRLSVVLQLSGFHSKSASPDRSEPRRATLANGTAIASAPFLVDAAPPHVLRPSLTSRLRRHGHGTARRRCASKQRTCLRLEPTTAKQCAKCLRYTCASVSIDFVGTNRHD